MIGLQLRGWARFLGRNLRTVKGALLALVGLTFFGLWLASLILTPRAGGADPEVVRRFGPAILLGYCLLNVVTSSSERAVYFTPAEVDFLFPAPFDRRTLLAYKVALSFLVGLPTTLFLTVVLQTHAAWFWGAFLGLLLAYLFLQLFTMAVNLLATAIGARLYTRGRRLILVGLLVGIGILALRSGPGTSDLLQRAERTIVWRIVAWPLSRFVETFLAQEVWPDLLVNAAMALGIDLLMLVVVFALDADFMEASASASARIYAQLQRVRRGEGVGPRSGKARFSLPTLPWLGGIGPIFWRQLTTAVRGLGRLLFLLLIFGTLMVGPSLTGGSGEGDLHVVGTAVGMVVAMSLFLTTLVPYDFRGDVDRLDVLKSLPVAPWRLAVGQLLTPVLLLTLVQWIVLGVVQGVMGRVAPLLLVFAAFALPFNFLLFGLENLLFLLFPMRLTAAAPGDFQAMGRNVLFLLAKTFSLALVGGMAALMGGLVYYLVGLVLPATTGTGERVQWSFALAAAWGTVALAAAGLVPLVARAFVAFDVARDTPP